MFPSAREMRMLSGIAAAAVAVGVAQLLAVGFGPAAVALNAVGSAVIDLAPGPVKEWAIRTFGTADKLFLSVLVVAVIVAIAAITGMAERRRVPVGSAAIVLGGIAGCAAVISRAGATAVDIVPTIVGMCCGVAVLRLLTARLAAKVPEKGVEVADPGRRLWLAALGLLGLGLVGGVAGAVLTRRLHSVAGDRNAFAVPQPVLRAPPLPDGVQPKGVVLPSFITSNRDFYRI